MTATQAEHELIEFEPGAEESKGRNWIFVNLRAGKIGQTSNVRVEGYEQRENVLPNGTKSIFYAKTLDHLTGYVKDIYWHTHTLDDGTKLSGWKIVVDAGAEKGVFVLSIGSTERAFNEAMNLLANVDFTRVVRFRGFWGTDRQTGKTRKVFLVTQGIDPLTHKPVWVQPAFKQRWLSRLTADKIRDGRYDLPEAERKKAGAKIELSEEERANIAWADGKFDASYPYIRQNIDDSWSFDTWTNFLHEQMTVKVIPAVQAAAQEREDRMPPAIDQTEDVPGDEVQYTGEPAPAYDDDIPF